MLRFAVAVALILLAGLALWWGVRPSERSPVAPSNAEPDAKGGDAAPLSGDGVPPPILDAAGDESNAGRSGARVAAPATAHWVDVGPPREGGEFVVSWSAFDNDVAGAFATRDETLALYLLEERTVRILARAAHGRVAGGIVSLDLPTMDTPLPSGIWVTHPASEPRFVGLPHGGTPATVLEATEPAARAVITVRDADGTPVRGAKVRQQALPADDYRPLSGDARSIGRRALIRESVTDENGSVARIPMDGPALIQASDGRSLARAFTDGEQRDLELVLAPTWSAFGNVRGVEDVGPWALVRVTAHRADDAQELGSIAVASDGSWGPLELPWLPGAGLYEACLDHGTVAPVSRSIDPPQPGASVRIDFDATAGHQFWTYVSDAATGEAVGGALVEWTWPSNERSGASSARSVTGTEGYAEFTSVPAGAAQTTVRADGYATHRGTPIRIDTLIDQVVGVDLSRPARIEGRVDYDESDPIGFLVLYDREGFWPLRHHISVFEPTDGSFAIDDLGPGAFVLQAVLRGQRATWREHVELRPGETSRVTLRVQPTAGVRGRVIDASSDEPLSGANVKVVMLGDRETMIGTLEDHWRTDERGHFEVTGIPLDDAALEVEYGGYEIYRAPLTLQRADHIAELGLVPLWPEFDVAARLVGEAADPAAYAARLQGKPASIRHFDADRRVQLAGAGHAGNVALVHPSGVEDRHIAVAARAPAAPIALHVWPGAASVSFEGPDGEPAALSGECHLYWTDPNGLLVIRALLGVAGERLEMPGLPATPIGYSARSRDGRLAAGTGHVGADGVLSIRLDERVLRIKVVDREGRAVERAVVQLDQVDGQHLVLQQADVTDADGVARFAARAGGEHFVGVRAADERRITQRRLQLSGAEQEVELVLEAAAVLRVALRENGQPLANAPYLFALTYGRQSLATGTTDLAGLATLDRVGADPVLVEIALPARWPISEVVEPSDVPVVLHVRRRGGLELRAVDGTGVPVAGTDVTLEHAAVEHFDRVRGPLGGDVRTWMGAGLVPARELRTDSTGRLVVEGLPDGEYRVVVTAGDGRWIAGAVEIVGDDVAKATLLLP